MKLSDLPWREYGAPRFSDTDIAEIADASTADGRSITLWRPGSHECEVELKVQGGPHEFLTTLEARCRLIELGARLPTK